MSVNEIVLKERDTLRRLTKQDEQRKLVLERSAVERYLCRTDHYREHQRKDIRCAVQAERL